MCSCVSQAACTEFEPTDHVAQIDTRNARGTHPRTDGRSGSVQSSIETGCMTERTTQSTVIFNHPSRLHGVDLPLSPGAYVEDEIIPGLSIVAYRRLRTSIILPFNNSPY